MYRYRGQARSYRGRWLGQRISPHHKSHVGAGLPAMAVGQAVCSSADVLLSRASPLLQGTLAWAENLDTPQITCGSWLAGDGGGSGSLFCGWCTAIAGKPAPTGDAGLGREFRHTANHMWELACRRWRRVRQYVLRLMYRYRGQARSYRGRWLGQRIWPHCKSHVGAGLPAMTVGQAVCSSADVPLSRASPLLQGALAWAENLATLQITCGSWLAGDGGGSGSMFFG
jgi:hypothetical protein